MFRLNRRGQRAPQGLSSSRLSYLRFLLLAALIASCAGSASAQSGELVQYPSEEIGFICGPQLKTGSASNPFPWFDKTQVEQGHALGRMTPAVAPRVLTGKVTVQQGSTFVDGVGTRFTSEVDPNGPAPLYNGWLRVKMADGTYREARVASVASDARLVLTAAWPHASASVAEADTHHYDATLGYWNYDRYFDSAYYDLALVQYINYYRTGDPAFLAYARRAADSWWGSPYIGHGTVDSGPNSLPPRSMAYAGLMLRALDGRPEMWDFIHRRGSFIFDHWVLKRVNDKTLYYDMREDAFAQLYAVLIAKALPDSYDSYPQGTLAPAAGRVTDGAQKRADLLRDAGRTAVEFFGRLQKPDGSWRWDITIDGVNLIATEQPFMVGLYLESVVALDRITQDPAVKASLRTQLEKSVRHLYTQAYRGTETVSDMPQYKWRGMWYFWGGGTAQDPTLYERGQGAGDLKTNGEVWVIGGARHLNSTVHHAFGYAYALTGNAEYLQMGEDVFDASYGERVDGIRGYANTGRGKDYAMNYRASGRFLAWRLGQAATAPTPTPTPAPTPAPVAAAVNITSPANGAQFTEPANVTVTVDVTPGSGGVSKVEFFDGATLLGESSAKPYTFVWNNVPAGTHVLTARATDWSGQSVTSAAVTFKVARAGDSVVRARRNAQATSNQLAQ
ncbi:MAG TPA: Ig-like domain-containing protein, partial [Pyrinomonadaceae bacterium]|nr:Ig-like domain-containing protein [Pyrinomonadaceae bacterium]